MKNDKHIVTVFDSYAGEKKHLVLLDQKHYVFWFRYDRFIMAVKSDEYFIAGYKTAKEILKELIAKDKKVLDTYESFINESHPISIYYDLLKGHLRLEYLKNKIETIRDTVNNISNKI